jgi:putative DNA primase/helicase
VGAPEGAGRVDSDVSKIARALDDAAQHVAVSLLGEPTSRTRDAWRWGTHGSLAVEVAGSKRGRWFDHEAGKGGDMLALARRQHRGDMAAALHWSRRWLGMPLERTGKVAGESGRRPAPMRHPVPNEPHGAACSSAEGAMPTDARAGAATEKTALLRAIWSQTVPIEGTIAESYLRRARGLSLPTWPADLRFHPACRRGTEVLPALVAVMRDPVACAGCGLHRTFLLPDGSDRLRDPMGRAMLGRAGVVMLSPSADVTMGLHLAEGVESTLAALALGFAPAWAATSAGGIARFPVLPGIEALTIFADADGPGLAAAQRCAARWRAEGNEVRVLAPVKAGADMNDVAREAAA